MTIINGKTPDKRLNTTWVRTIKVLFRGQNNIILKLLTCEDKILIPSKLQSYVLHWYHTYLLHPGMDIMEAMICQFFYWTGIIKSVCKEITNSDTCQRTKWTNKKYGKLPAKEAE